jgi:hypothetical protein
MVTGNQASGNSARGNVLKKGHRGRTMSEQDNATVVDTSVLALIDKEGSTRGKNPRKITFKVLNRIAKSVEEFMSVTGIKTEPELAELLSDGYNSASYSAASDEIGEYIEDGWSKDVQTAFRNSVRGMSKMLDVSIDEVAPMLKAKLVAKLEADKARAETVTA